MSPRHSIPRPASARSRRQRIAAGAVLATTSLLGTYLAALGPQPTYAVTPALAAFITPSSIPTCAQADTTVTTEADLRRHVGGRPVQPRGVGQKALSPRQGGTSR